MRKYANLEALKTAEEQFKAQGIKQVEIRCPKCKRLLACAHLAPGSTFTSTCPRCGAPVIKQT